MPVLSDCLRRQETLFIQDDVVFYEVGMCVWKVISEVVLNGSGSSVLDELCRLSK